MEAKKKGKVKEWGKHTGSIMTEVRVAANYFKITIKQFFISFSHFFWCCSFAIARATSAIFLIYFCRLFRIYSKALAAASRCSQRNQPKMMMDEEMTKWEENKEDNVNLSWISSRNVWIIYDANLLNLNYELADIRALIRSVFDDDELMPHEIAPHFTYRLAPTSRVYES